ncbi:MAG: vitamin B12 dependent-methionine synthase activation domain-containing protein [Anaerolineae bacterium]
MDTASSEQAFVLDDIAFQPQISVLAKRLRLKPDSGQISELKPLLNEATSLARPKAMYRLAFIDEKRADSVLIDGVELRSRVLRVNLEIAHRVFAYIATCGTELQAWGEGLDDMVHQYWADAIKELALGAAIRALDEHLHACYELGKTATMAPGSLADWPIREQRPLFRVLGDPKAAIGVELTDSFLMIPNKTVSGIRFPTEERFESCQLCPRDICPGRRAAYEPDLFERKYNKAQAD